MRLEKGSVVRATAGRDSGGHFVVVTAEENGRCTIADGKSRKLASPKRKNVKHLRPVNSVIDINDITDKKLRNLLKQFGEAE